MKKYLAILFITFLSCTSDKVDQIVEDEGSNTEELEKLTPEELEYMTNLLTVDSEMSTFWKNFNLLREIPVYIKTGDHQGILINPPNSLIKSSRPILNELTGFETLNLFRNDEMYNFVDPGYDFWIYNTLLEYEGIPIYTYNITQNPEDIGGFGGFYHDYKNRNGFFHFSIFFHELFHLYTVILNEELFVSDDFTYESKGHEFNEETLPLILLLYDVMIDAYHLENSIQKTNYLKYYVSILHKLNSIDSTENNLIRNHFFFREKSEGTARYIEVFFTLNTIDNNTIEDPSHGWKGFSENIDSWGLVMHVYNFRMPYHTGAGAIHLLKELDCPDLEEKFFIPENTPYDIAKEFLNMNDLQLDVFLQGAKTLYDWDALVERSEYLLSLQ